MIESNKINNFYISYRTKKAVTNKEHIDSILMCQNPKEKIVVLFILSLSPCLLFGQLALNKGR